MFSVVFNHLFIGDILGSKVNFQFYFLFRNVDSIYFSWVETHHSMQMTTTVCKNHK